MKSQQQSGWTFQKCLYYTAVSLALFIVSSLPTIIFFVRNWLSQPAEPDEDDPYGLNYEDHMPQKKMIRFPDRFMDIRIDDPVNAVATHFMKDIFCEIGADSNVRLVTANKLCFSLEQAFRESMDPQHCEQSVRMGWRRLAKNCVPAAKALPNGTDISSPLVMKALCQVVTHHTKVLRTAFLEVMCEKTPNGKFNRNCRGSFDGAWLDVAYKCNEWWKTDDDWLKVAREQAAKKAKTAEQQAHEL